MQDTLCGQCLQLSPSARAFTAQGPNLCLQLWNALKYSTAFPVIALSAAKAAVRQSDWCGKNSHHLNLLSSLWLKSDNPCSVPQWLSA